LLPTTETFILMLGSSGASGMGETRFVMPRERGASSSRQRQFSIEMPVVTGSSAFADDDNGLERNEAWMT
jgi:hypothetical protein